MPVLSNSKYEKFAQLVAKGVSDIEAYTSAGYSKASARSNASRLRENEGVSARIKELISTIAEQVITAEIRRRSWRVQILQTRLDGMLALSQARATMYAEEMGGTHKFAVADEAAELAAIKEGCAVLDLPPALPTPGADWKDEPKPPPEYPKTMVHPGYSVGGHTGMLMKDFRGKDANQEVWKFDSALEASIRDAMKQAAIEEGQWTEKREISSEAAAVVIKTNLQKGMMRVAEEKAAALARGDVWSE